MSDEAKTHNLDDSAAGFARDAVCAPLRYAPSKNISRTRHPHRDLSATLRSGRDDKGEAVLHESIFSREESLQSFQDMNDASIQQPLSLKRCPSPLSSRPERSVAERSLCGCLVLEMFFVPYLPA